MSEVEQAFLDAYDVLARGDGVLDDEVANRWRPLYDRLRQPTPESTLRPNPQTLDIEAIRERLEAVSGEDAWCCPNCDFCPDCGSLEKACEKHDDSEDVALLLAEVDTLRRENGILLDALYG